MVRVPGMSVCGKWMKSLASCLAVPCVCRSWVHGSVWLGFFGFGVVGFGVCGRLQGDSSLRSFVSEVLSAVQEQHGPALGDCLVISGNNFHTAKMIGRCRDEAIDAACKPLQALGWHRAVAAVVRAGLAAASGAWVAAHRHLLQCLGQFGALFGAAKSNWMVPALVVIVREAVAVTSAAESHVVRTGEGARTQALKELAIMLADVYRTTQDRAMGDASKKLGTLTVVNGLLRLNFRLHSMRSCLPYVDSVVRMCGGPGVVVPRGAEAPPLPDPDLAMERFPLSQTVTFAYYQGRLLMFDHSFAVVSATGTCPVLCHVPRCCVTCSGAVPRAQVFCCPACQAWRGLLGCELAYWTV